MHAVEMSRAVFTVLVSILATTSTIDIKRLQIYPEPLKSLDLNKYGGIWYIQGRYVPCSWAGSNTFTDFVYSVKQRGNSYISDSHWRQEGICSNVVSTLHTQSPGILIQKDAIGGVYSGYWYILETDYKRYSVSYGCTKPSVTGDKCSDPWICVDTRHPRPDRYTLTMIDRALKDKFGLTYGELLHLKHENPCLKSAPRSHYNYLTKKY